MSIDNCTHSLFGVSKAAADLLVQEYGRYFDMPTVAFRGGCLTGPQHAGAKLHGFLAYLMKCTVTGTPYTVFGYEGKQVRDNIHCADLIAAFDAFRRPRARPRSTTSAAAGSPTARCWRRSTSASGSPARAELEMGRSRGSATTAGGSPTWPRSKPTTRTGSFATGSRTSSARCTSKPRALDGERGMKLSVVIPAQNEEGSIGATVAGVVAALERQEIDYEIIVVNDDSETPPSGGRGDRRREPAGALPPLPLRTRLRLCDPCRARRLRGRRGGDRDGRRLRRPRGPRRASTACSKTAMTASSARALCPAARSTTTQPEARDQPARQLHPHPLPHRYNDTTNAFKAYRREVIETVQPLLSKHFNLTVEMPLNASSAATATR